MCILNLYTSEWKLNEIWLKSNWIWIGIERKMNWNRIEKTDNEWSVQGAWPEYTLMFGPGALNWTFIVRPLFPFNFNKILIQFLLKWMKIEWKFDVDCRKQKKWLNCQMKNQYESAHCAKIYFRETFLLMNFDEVYFHVGFAQIINTFECIQISLK